jgi:hypothetical protein
VQDLDRSYLRTDGNTLSYLKMLVKWQDCQSEYGFNNVEGWLDGALNDMPVTYHIPDLDVIIQAPHKVASSSLKSFVESINTTYNLKVTRWESMDDYLRFVNLHKPVIYRLVREPVCRALSNINFQSRSFYKLYGVSLDLALFNPNTGIDPHSSPQSSSMLCYVSQEVYDNMIKLRAERIRIFIRKVISDENKVAYGTDAEKLASLLGESRSDESLLQYYRKFKKIDTTHAHFYQDLYWAHLNDITLYENTKYLWATETNSSVFEFLAKELDLPRVASNVVVNNTPLVPIGGRMPYKVDTLDYDTKYKLYESYKPEIDFLKELHYENTEAIFYDQ